MLPCITLDLVQKLPIPAIRVPFVFPASYPAVTVKSLQQWREQLTLNSLSTPTLFWVFGSPCIIAAVELSRSSHLSHKSFSSQQQIQQKISAALFQLSRHTHCIGSFSISILISLKKGHVEYVEFEMLLSIRFHFFPYLGCLQFKQP